MKGEYDLILETNRLILRHWQESDVDILFEYASDPDVGPIAGWPVHESREYSLDVIRNVFNGPECYAVCLKDCGLVVGAIELLLNGRTDMTDRDDECEHGYWIGKPHRGNEYAPEAAGRLIEHGFLDLGMRTIWCGYYDGNSKSRIVQEKLGFVFHHTCDEVDVPLLNEVRIGHTNIMTRKHWLSEKMNNSLYDQLARDYCCDAADIYSSDNIFSEYRQIEGQRRFKGQEKCPLKIAVVNGKLLFTGRREIVEECRKRYENASGKWFMDIEKFRELDSILSRYGCKLKSAHPFYLPTELSEQAVRKDTTDKTVDSMIKEDFNLVRYTGDEILQFKGDDRWCEAFCFDDNTPDVLAVAAVSDGEIIGMAGASADSDDFWQIGINVVQDAEGRHVGTSLVSELTMDILRCGRIPYYGTGMSHIASQRVAAAAGYDVFWFELLTGK